MLDLFNIMQIDLNKTMKLTISSLKYPNHRFYKDKQEGQPCMIIQNLFEAILLINWDEFRYLLSIQLHWN